MDNPGEDTTSLEFAGPLQQAFQLGVAAKQLGRSIGSNPFDAELEPRRHEYWLDGWAAAQKGDQ